MIYGDRETSDTETEVGAGYYHIDEELEWTQPLDRTSRGFATRLFTDNPRSHFPQTHHL